MKNTDQFNINIFEHKEKSPNNRAKAVKYMGGLALGLVLLTSGCSAKAVEPCATTGESVSVHISKEAKLRTEPGVKNGSDGSNLIAETKNNLNLIIKDGDIHISDDDINGDWIGIHASDIINANPELKSHDVIDILSGDNRKLNNLAEKEESGKDYGIVWVNSQKANVEKSIDK